jgi:energy-converting hydrogenase Eha subunit A
VTGIVNLPLPWEQLLLWSTGASLLALAATVVGIPWVVARLPADYFSSPRRHSWRTSDHEPLPALVLGLLKNVVGAVLVVLGFVMLFTPGQGVLTLLAGLLLMNFPGKYQLERWLVCRRGVLKGLNWLRRRHGQPPLVAPGSAAD